LPGSAVRIQLSTDYPEETTVPPFETRAILQDGSYVLENHFVEYVLRPDTIITITIDGKEVFSGKVKYGEEIGIARECPWVRVTELTLPTSGGK